MAGRDEVNVIALVENLELPVPRRLPLRLVHGADKRASQASAASQQQQQARFIELGDRDSEIAIKRKLNLDVGPEDKIAHKSGEPSEFEERESLEILRRLPPNTVLIKQVEEKVMKEEKMEKAIVKEEYESEGQHKKFRIRSKKNSLEVRRNPLRSAAVRKDVTRLGRVTSSRQRLLAARRKPVLGSVNVTRSTRYSTPQSGALAPATTASNTSTTSSTATTTAATSLVSSSTTTTTTTTTTGGSTSLSSSSSTSLSGSGYMSTRSVTRKQGSVGATHEAPTWRDEAEWKEWPAHGMHERPVYHPQFGLAAEYNGRLYASFDNQGYREITAELEVVRVDPRVESLDRREEASREHHQQQQQQSSSSSGQAITALRACAGPEVARYVRQQSAAAAIVRQKLVAAAAGAAAAVTGHAHDKPRAATATPAACWPVAPGYGARSFERLHTLTQSLGLAHQQQQHHHHHHYHHHHNQYQQQLEQLRGLERLQHLENLQRLSSRIHRLQQHQQSASCSGETSSKYTPVGRFLPTDVFRSLQQSQQKQQSLANNDANCPSSDNSSPSVAAGSSSSGSLVVSPAAKCLIVPRAIGSPANPAGSVALPFYGVQGIKGKPKGKLFFVRASDATSKKLLPSKSSKDTGISWAEVSLRKRPDGSPALRVDVARTSSLCSTSSPRTSRLGYPPIRLAEATSIFRPRVALAPREDPALTAANRSSFELTDCGLAGIRTPGYVEDQQAVVLDLSKKEASKKTEQPMELDGHRSGCDDSKAQQSCTTDLVDYFKNFGADESIDLFEDPKNLT